MRLLLVEDDTLLGDGIRAGLAQEGFAVDWLTNGQEALAALLSDHFDLVVLDLGLPDLPGLEVLRRLRGEGRDLPVLILTARDAVADRVAGLDAGADDYLTKPFDLEELNARIRALLRRAGGRASPLLSHGALSLDPAARTVTLDEAPVELSRREYAVLHTLLEHRGKVLSKNQLEEALYGWEMEVESNTLEVYIHHLRKKLGSTLIRTVRGVGYTIPREPAAP
ncbi:response regulator [Endothiovibrio diazotrophicus]